jgi:hypothetical protein
VLTANTFSGVYYTVDSSNVLFLELDSTQLGLGALQVQSASANSSARSNLAAAHLAMLRSTRANAKKAWRAK